MTYSPDQLAQLLTAAQRGEQARTSGSDSEVLEASAVLLGQLEELGGLSAVIMTLVEMITAKNPKLSKLALKTRVITSMQIPKDKAANLTKADLDALWVLPEGWFTSYAVYLLASFVFRPIKD
ncbi:TPA: hypothetical protein SMO99_002997 [Proteus mirabilis]|uniref:Uncharacterized protein n=1 Tax=Morganella morganii TaxID=582 RepID=A0AAI9MUE1_MORMO|nr:hypothetical protein [Klebsiella pneumoniae]EKW8762770.1 hypothetical protein [Morganella morganii]HEJ9424957.1 hypothetical protein [Proteus mirabilis]HEJ9454153.1 hypothetical protein [Proteus mirabilis]HEJ9465785.1 hypothetical protein [Proteus mirabilis]